MVISTYELDRIVQNDWHGDIPPHCIRCGYDLRGRASNQCPECGEPFNRRRWKQHAADIRAKVQQIDQMADIIPVGLFAALAGAAIRIGGLLVGTSSISAWIGRGLGFMLGMAAIYLGLGIFRSHELPDWAREKLKTKPNAGYAIAAVSIGACLVASVFLPW